MNLDEMSNAELAEAAAERIDQYGWIKGFFGNQDIGYCLLGAFRSLADFELNIYDELESRGAQILSPVVPNYNCTCGCREAYVKVPNWNDDICESKEQALDKLTEAAKYWRNKGE